jgi:hypothetical protein
MSWSDPDTGRSREVAYGRGGKAQSEFGLVPDGGSMRTVLVMYDAKMWTSHRGRAFPRIANEAASLAQATRDKVASGKVKIVGRMVVDGRRTVHLEEVVRLPKQSAPRGVRLPKALSHPRLLHVDTWADPLTYLPVRTRTSDGFGWSVSDTEWLPRTPANVSKTRLVIPAGFKQQVGGGFTSYTDSVRFRCAQS